MFTLRDHKLGLVWLAARVWVGFTFLQAAWEKLNDPAWVGEHAPAGIHGFLSFATSPPMTTGDHPQVSGWYAWLINHAFLPADGFMGYLVVSGELAVGLALILGIFTLPAAFFGLVMNLNYLLAGDTGSGKGPVMLTLELLILFAGTSAYAYGLDRLLIPRLKTAARNWRTEPQLRTAHHLEH
jgi:thiosulfate dehydrogenase (quinone) large subunit